MIHKIKLFVFDILTNTFGKLMVSLRPEKARRLSENGITLVLNENLNITELLMRHAILKKLEKKQEYNTLAELHHNYWKNKGDDFFSTTKNSFEKEFLPDCSFIFGILKEELLKEPEKFNTLVEIGTGNGAVLEYLSGEFPEINRFIGIDLSPVQIKNNDQKFKENNKLEFVASDGFEWVKANGQNHTIFVTSRGVLEYFTQERLQAFLQEINNLGKTIFIAIEPKGTDHNFDKNPNSQLYGFERSFSHNYTKIFKSAGFNIWHSSYKTLSQSTIMNFIGAKN